jgi:nitroreductase
MSDAVVNSDLGALQRLMSQRFSCRAYRPDSVPEDVIRSILEVAGKTPSWCNVQPWRLVIASRETTDAFRAALTDYATRHPEIESDLPFPREYRGIYAERRRTSGYALYDALGIDRRDKARREAQSFENFRMFGAPHVAIVTMPADLGPYAAVDCGGFVTAFLLAAQALGVATTPQAALARHAAFVRTYFGIDDGLAMVCGVSFGYANLEHPANLFRTTRAPLDEVMRFA